MPDDAPIPPTRPALDVRAGVPAAPPVRPFLDESRLPSLAPSGRLRFVAGYFRVSGWLTLLSLAALLLGRVLGSLPARVYPPHGALGVALALLSAVGWIWTGRLLRRRRRAGGQMALAMLALPILDMAGALARGEPRSVIGLVVSVLGCLLVLSVWRELGDDDED